MPANFPDSPTLNQTYTYGAMTWQWTGSYWSVVESANYTAVTAITANLVPSVNEVYNLGSSTLRWRDLYLSGNSLVLGAATISASGSAITLPANSSIGTTSFGSTSLTTQDLTVSGNLTVNGTTTTINSTTLSIDDKNIVLADGAANAAAADGAGITVAGATATLTYASASDTWNVNKNILITPGTANGVLYLNASKVATTGSVLTFDGAQLGVNGITIGRGAGAVSTNTALGVSVLAANTTGAYNTGVGELSLTRNTSGSLNTAVGRETLAFNTTGQHNTSIGHDNMYANTTGSYNTALGSWALQNNTTASNNTAVGYQALYSNATAGSMVAVGVGALYSEASSGYAVAIGRDAYFTHNAAENYGSVAVGFYSGRAATTGIDNTFIGGYAARNHTTGNYNVALGAAALFSNTTASQNTAVGYQAAYSSTTSEGITAVGWQAIYSGNGAGVTGIGRRALYTNTGNYNTAVGTNSMFSNTSGESNVGLGHSALFNNTTANNNTAVGYQAGYSNTTGTGLVALGYLAANANTTGNFNTAIGSNALQLNTTGSGNTMLGLQAGYGITTGSYNTFVGFSSTGYGSGQLVTTGFKNTILGGYNGNQGGLDIRTANNYIVLSDGDGNPRLAINGTEWLLAAGGTSTTGDVISNGGGNTSGYNGILIGANMRAITTQANTGLPSWLVDIGGRAADGTTYQLTTADKFRVLRVAAGGSFYGTQAAFEVNSNGCVGLNTSAASTGTGITFPATQVASSDANTLDDYEEGSFTPDLSFGNGTTGITYLYRNGTYVKIGRLVFVRFGMYLSNKGSSTGTARVGGLPFTSYSESYSDPSIMFNGSTFSSLTAGVTGLVLNNTTSIEMRTNTTTGTASLNNTNFNNTTEFYGSACYYATT